MACRVPVAVTRSPTDISSTLVNGIENSFPPTPPPSPPSPKTNSRLEHSVEHAIIEGNGGTRSAPPPAAYRSESDASPKSPPEVFRSESDASGAAAAGAVLGSLHGSLLDKIRLLTEHPEPYDIADGPDPQADHVLDAVHMTLVSPMVTPHMPRSHAGRLAHLGCSMFTLVFVTMWSATVTTRLVTDSLAVEPSLQSLQEAVKNDIRICSQGALNDQMAAGLELPAPTQSWSPASVAPLMVGRNDRGANAYSTSGSLDAMDKTTSGNGPYCKAAVVELSQLQAAMSLSGERHCNKVLGPVPLAQVLGP